MTQEAMGPDQLLSKGNAALEETAACLRELLHRAAGQLQPFPYFLGSHTIQAVEADPPKGVGPDRGCVVVCPDGELYELTVSFNQHPLDRVTGMERDEKVEKLDLPHLEYIPYAYNALAELTRLLSQDRGQ